MRVKLLVDIPEAKTKEECRQLLRTFWDCGKDNSLIDVNIRNFELDFKGRWESK